MENESPSSLGFFGILRETFKTTSINWKMLVAVLLPTFLSFSQLEFSLNYIQIPLVKDFAMQLALHPNSFSISRILHLVAYRSAFDDILELIGEKHLTLALSCAIKLFFSVIVVSSSSLAYTAKVRSRQDLLLKIRKWKEPLHTSFYMILITFGIICGYAISYGITNILVVNSWSALFSNAISLSIPICYLYMSPLWMLSVVVSVLEGFGGFKAIRRAVNLMNGKRLQASLLMVPFVIAEVFIHYVFHSFLRSYDRRKIKNYKLIVDIWIYYSKGTTCLMNLFMFVTYTVFYHEQKNNFEHKQVKGNLSSHHCC